MYIINNKLRVLIEYKKPLGAHINIIINYNFIIISSNVIFYSTGEVHDKKNHGIA